MDRGSVPAIRSLPRFFVDGINPDATLVVLPSDERKKIKHVLRLVDGDWIAVLPNNGEIWACQLINGDAVPVQKHVIENPTKRKVTLAQGLPRPEKLEEVVRMGTEVGVDAFLIFPSDRSVVRWDEKKIQEKLRRLRVIAREASEVCGRPTLPIIHFTKSLADLIGGENVIVLSETDGIEVTLQDKLKAIPGDEVTLVIGPEGGWSPREVAMIGNKAATMGKLIFRVDTAAISACAIALLTSD